MKKFWKKTEGFTLVELVVVIAILGILAGVGTVGYSGYIEKANAAADEQLLREIQNAGILGSIEDPGVVGSVTVYHKSENKDAEASASVIDWLVAVFGDNWAESLELASAVYVNSNNACQIPLPNFSMEAVEGLNKYTQSNFYGNETTIANSANNLSVGLANWIGTDGVAAMEGYFSATEYAAFKAQFGLDDSSSATEVANATVLYVASKANSINAEEMMSDLQDASMSVETLTAKYGALPMAAMCYGVMTGYSMSDGASQKFKDDFAVAPNGLGGVYALWAQMKNDTGYGEYLEDSAVNDAQGYLGALQVIDEQQGQFNLSDNTAFNNDETMALLGAILGK